MNNQILNDETVVYYVVRANGQTLTQKFESHMLAEAEKQRLSPELQQVAEVVPVTAEGHDLLLG